MLLHQQVCDKSVWFLSYAIVGRQEPEQNIFDLIKISDLAYTVAVIENSHEIWEQCNEGQNVSSKIGQERWERNIGVLLTKKTPRFMKRAGKKR
jgi:hypothetical protein